MLINTFVILNILSIVFLLIALKYKDLMYYVMSSTFALLIAVMILFNAAGLEYVSGSMEQDTYIYGDNLSNHWDTSEYSQDPSGNPNPNDPLDIFIVHIEKDKQDTYSEIRPFWSNLIGLLYLGYALYMLFISYYTYKPKDDKNY